MLTTMYDRKTYKEIKPIYYNDWWEYPDAPSGPTGHCYEALFKDSKGYRLYCESDFNGKYAELVHGFYQSGCRTKNISKKEAFAWATEGLDAEYAAKHWQDIMNGKYRRG